MILNTIVTNHNFTEKLEQIKNSNLIFVPVYNNEQSIRYLCRPNVIFIYIIANGETLTFPFNHSDLDSLDLSNLVVLIKALEQSTKNIITINKKDHVKCLNFTNCIDVNIFEWSYGLEITNNKNHYTSAHNYFKNNNKPFFDFSFYVPIIKLYEYYTSIRDYILDFIKNHKLYLSDKTFKFINEEINVFSKLESNGLFIDYDKYNRKDTLYDNRIFPDYYLFNKSFRPSPSSGYVNMSSMKKESNIRESIISRFEGGRLIEFDYKAAHLYYLGNVVDYEFKEYPYLEVARDVLNTNDVSADDIAKIKKLTQTVLYGDIKLDLPFFNKVNELKAELVESNESSKFIELPKSGVRIFNVDSRKVMSYFVHGIETETNTYTMSKIQSFLEKKSYKSKLIFYMYDSFLFDIHPDEKDVINDLERLINGRSMQTHISGGLNWSKLRKIK
jgi:hypothetical protein